MPKRGIYVCSIGLAILFVSNIDAQKRLPFEPSGREIYMDRCSSCHGENGKGNGPVVAVLKIAPGDLTLLAKKNSGIFPEDRVKSIAGDFVLIPAHGSRETPVWGDIFHPKRSADLQIAQERFKNLVDYLQSIQRKRLFAKRY